MARRGVLQLVAWGDPSLPGWQLLDQAFRQQLANRHPGPIDFYTEYLDLSRFSGADYEASLAQLLKRRNNGRIDVVAAFGAPALAFALNQREAAWPGVPVVFGLVEQNDIGRLRPGPGVTGVTVVVDPRRSLEAALTLQPDTRHVVVIGGSLPFDQARIAQARRQFESYQSRLEFTYVSDLSMADLLRRVHELPSHSIVLVLHLFRDGAGQEFRPYDSFQMIARASNVPVYGVLDSYMGAGMVGGQVASFPAQGRVAGELAARVLAGESPDRLGIRAEGTHLVYDWTQLRRWGLGERRVPPDAVVRFREPGIWEQYGWYIAAAMVICSLQAGLIAALLFQRSARHEAQRSLQDRVRFLGLVIELSASSLRLTAAEVDRWIADWLRRLGVFLGVDRAAVIVEQMGALRATHTWSTASIGPLPPTAVGDVPWAASALRRGEIVQVSRLPELPPAAATDRATWQRFGVKSFLATPLTKRGSTISALSFATHRGERTWPDELVTHLRLIGHIFASAFAMRRAEIARYASEQLSGTLLGVLSAPSAVVDRQSNILRVNQAWRQLAREAGPTALPWGPVGSNYLEICRRAGTAGVTTTPEALSGIEAALSGGNGEFRLKYDWASSTGRRRMEVLVAPLTRPEGGAVISHIDLTDRERAERETQELRQTIAHFGRVASLGELSASLAHELNQPLTAILSNVQAARRFLAAAPDNLGEIHEILTDIEEDDRRAGEVIRRLRTMIRKGQTEHQVFYLHDQVREVTHLIAPDTRIRQIPVVLELDSALPPVRADQIQLSQVILNLMMNGADAMEKINPGERELLLRTWRYDDASVALSVRDRGVGISVSPVDRIFEPFYTSKRDGMGMGLSICRSILEAHGGRIWASNNPDRGATLHLVLPISREEAR